MKVLFLTHQYFPRHVGGTEVYTRGLVRRLVQAGHQPAVITCHENPSPNPEDFGVRREDHEGVPVVEVHFNLSVTEHPARAEYDNPFPARAVAGELASFRPDVVHVMHGLKLSGAAVCACIDNGLPVVVTLCDYWFLCPRHTLLTSAGKVCRGPGRLLKCVPCLRDLHGFGRPPQCFADWRPWLRDLWAVWRRARYLRNTLLGARLVVALSHFQKKVFVANGYPADRLEVIEHGLDPLGAVLPPAEPCGMPWLRKLGVVGSMVPHKGVHVLLDALARLPHLAVECQVHGGGREDDPYVVQLRERAERDLRVRLAGPFAPSRLGEVLSGLDLLAAPALWLENNPLVVKAALQLGLPVLASRLGTLEEMIRPRGPEWLVPPGDATAWAAALDRLAQGPRPSFAPLAMKGMEENADEMIARYTNLLRACA